MGMHLFWFSILFVTTSSALPSSQFLIHTKSGHFVLPETGSPVRRCKEAVRQAWNIDTLSSSIQSLADVQFLAVQWAILSSQRGLATACRVGLWMLGPRYKSWQMAGSKSSESTTRIISNISELTAAFTSPHSSFSHLHSHPYRQQCLASSSPPCPPRAPLSSLVGVSCYNWDEALLTNECLSLSSGLPHDDQ